MRHSDGMFAWIVQASRLVLHIDTVLFSAVDRIGTWIYPILFLVVFCETGLVVTPFLPGDSLLFAAGALAGAGRLHLGVLLLVLGVAAIMGDGANYAIGANVGKRVLQEGKLLFIPIKREYIERTQAFYVQHGWKAVVFARFLPIVRAGVPFIAGVGGMDLAKFRRANVAGALAWTASFTAAGFFFGNLEAVKENFSLLIIAIIVISFVPSIIEVLRNHGKEKTPTGVGAGELEP